MREALVRSLEAALASPSIPPEIVTTLLNLAEFMEHNEKKLPLDTRQACLHFLVPVLTVDCKFQARPLLSVCKNLMLLSS